MNIRHILSAASLGLALAAHAATGYEINLSGKVVDASGGGLAGVEVAIKDADFKTTTDASGNWSLVREAAALRAPRVVTGNALGQGSVYNLMGSKMENSALARGVYIMRDAAGISNVETRRLAKALGDKDSLIVSFDGAEVGRVEQADLVAGALPVMTLRAVNPLLEPSTAGAAPRSFHRLVGQTVQVSYDYDALLWRPTWLTVGENKTAAAGNDFSILLANATDAISLELMTREQTIAFAALSGKTYGEDDFAVSATASSALGVFFASNTESVCTVSGATVRIVHVGECTLQASQAGNVNYNAALNVTQSFTVAPKAITVVADAQTKVYGDPDPTLTYSAPGLVGSDVLTGDLSRETGEDVGSYAITNALTNANYTVTFTGANLSITKAPLVFTSANPGTKLTADGLSFTTTFSVGPTLAAGVTVAFASITTPVCTYASGTVTLVSAGVCTIVATISAGANYTTTTVAQTFGVDLFEDARDHKQYKFVKIGAQKWMAENLNVGTTVSIAVGQSNNSVIERYCYDDDVNCATSGGFYLWAEAMAFPSACNTAHTPACGGTISVGNHQGICPTGWHIPKQAEWDALATELGGRPVAGGKMKTTGIIDWDTPNTGATNSSGFSAFPWGGLGFRNRFAFFWGATENSTTTAADQSMGYSAENLSTDYNLKTSDFSVRCLSDNP